MQLSITKGKIRCLELFYNVIFIFSKAKSTKLEGLVETRVLTNDPKLISKVTINVHRPTHRFEQRVYPHLYSPTVVFVYVFPDFVCFYLPLVWSRDGRLSEGDKVVAINGTRLSGLGHRDVVQLLQQYSCNNNNPPAATCEHSSNLQQAGGSDSLGTATTKIGTNLVSILVDTSQQLHSHQEQVQHLQPQHIGCLDNNDLVNSCWTSDGTPAGPIGQLQSGEFVPEMVVSSEHIMIVGKMNIFMSKEVSRELKQN